MIYLSDKRETEVGDLTHWVNLHPDHVKSIRVNGPDVLVTYFDGDTLTTNGLGEPNWVLQRMVESLTDHPACRKGAK